MKKTFVIILTLIGFITFGQENKLDRTDNELILIEPTELDKLYVKALNSRFDLILASGWNYVELNEYGMRIKNLNVSDRYKFLTEKELIDLSLKEKKTINVMRVIHETIAKDTVDLNFGIVKVNAERKIHFNQGLKFKKAEFNIGCAGGNGYEPDIRFVFDQQENNWKIISNRFITTAE